MNYLIDDVARTLAKPNSRRSALRLVGGAALGAFLGTIGARRASADSVMCNCTDPTHCTCSKPGSDAVNVNCTQTSCCCFKTGNPNTLSCTASSGGGCPGGCAQTVVCA